MGIFSLFLSFYLSFAQQKMYKSSDSLLEIADSQTRMRNFQEVAKKMRFSYESHTSEDYFNGLRDFSLFNQKELNPPVNTIVEKNAVSYCPMFGTNIIKGKCAGFNWEVFDLTVSKKAGKYHSSSYCTVFLLCKKTNFKRVAILKKEIFDFLRLISLKKVGLQKMKFKVSGNSKKFHFYSEQINQDLMLPLLNKINQSDLNLNVETAENAALFYTKSANFYLFNTEQLEETMNNVLEIAKLLP
jgi:hypothetical protein